MPNPFEIKGLSARELLDSRGFPTVEVDCVLTSGHRGSAIVPSGASTGEGEALELRDGDTKRFLGKGVLKAVENVRGPITKEVVGKRFASIAELDQAMLKLDGTPFKSKLGANSILAVSLAAARAHAVACERPTYAYLAELFGSQGVTLPVPLMNIINGGKHADNGLALQEFMIAPIGFDTFGRALQAGCEVFHALKKILHDQSLSTGVGDEGGFAPVFSSATPHEEAIQNILKAIEKAGYKPGVDIFLALDCAASEFCKDGVYTFEGKKLSSKEMTDVYGQWAKKYPIISIEDGLSEHDWSGWAHMTATLGNQLQLVGDDLFVTNTEFLKQGFTNKAANSILIKVNQIGTLTETLATMKLAKENGYTQISSHRSGESEDTFIAHLAVGTDCGQIKTGSASRTDRIAKYNELLRIEEQLGARARFAGRSAFKGK